MDSVEIYSDLIKDFYEYNSLKPDSSFPILTSSDEFVSDIEKYEIIEFIFIGVRSQRTQEYFSERLALFKQGLKEEFFNKERNNIYLFAMEYGVRTKSRVRSYKGLMYKREIKQDDYLQMEIDLPNNQSIIALVANFEKENFNTLVQFLYDDTTCFVIKSDRDYFNKDFIKTVISALNLGSIMAVDYLQLMKLFCSVDDIVYRIGGDGGDDYWSLQKLIKKSANM